MELLTESLMRGDLRNMVKNIFTIDNFESKIDEDAIVLSFFIKEETAAKELAVFIERSSLETLDTEVSSAPDENGYYLIFVELDRNDTSFLDILKLLQIVNHLVGDENWIFTGFRLKNAYEANEKNLKKYLSMRNKTIKKKNSKINESVISYKDRDEFITGKDVAFTKVCESSLSRLIQHFKNDFAIITAYRSEFNKIQNVIRNRELRTILNDMNLGVHGLIGFWQECIEVDEFGNIVDYDKCKKENLKLVVERSYFVPRNDSIEPSEFKKIMIDLANKFGQDGFILKLENEFGVINPKNKQLIYKFSKFTLDELQQAYSKHVKKQNVSFTFEGIEKPEGSALVKRAFYEMGFRW